MQNYTSAQINATTFPGNVSSTTPSTNIDECAREFVESTASLAVRVSTQVLIAVIMFGLGCSTEVKAMWRYVKRPKQFATGLALQLLVMPFLGLGLSQAFQMTQAESMGVIIQASCPGGAYSNIASYFLDGDMDLSIVMTTVSTIFSLGTMPLWLFVFPIILQVTNNCIQVPFDALGYALLAIIVPVLVGLLVKHKFSKQSKIITRVCTIVGSLGIVAVVIYAVTNENDFIKQLTWRIIVVALLFPLLALVIGYLATRLPWLSFNMAARRTIAIETAMQNSAIGTSIILVSFDFESPIFGSLLLFPGTYGIVQLVATLIVVIVYIVCKKVGCCLCLQPVTDDQKSPQPDVEPNGFSNPAYDNESNDNL